MHTLDEEAAEQRRRGGARGRPMLSAPTYAHVPGTTRAAIVDVAVGGLQLGTFRAHRTASQCAALCTLACAVLCVAQVLAACRRKAATLLVHIRGIRSRAAVDTRKIE